MALSDENGSGMVMPVQPMGYGGGYGGGYGYPAMGYPVMPMMGGFGGGYGGFGGDWSWILLLLLISNGGWGGLGGFGGGMMWPMMGMMDGGFGLYPWMNQAEVTTSGFQNAATNSAISSLQNSVTSGFGDVQLGIAGVNQSICQTGNGIQNALCSGFAGTTAAVTGAQNALAQQMYQNELNSLNRSFAEQSANTAAVNGLSSQLADCCCENRLAVQGLNSTILAENCADRAAVSDGIRDLLTAGTANTQSVLNAVRGIYDQMCQDKIDAKNERITSLENQLNMANLAASQTAQTARLLADNAAQTQAVENYIRPQINPAYVVPNPYAGTAYGYCGCNNGIN